MRSGAWSLMYTPTPINRVSSAVPPRQNARPAFPSVVADKGGDSAPSPAGDGRGKGRGHLPSLPSLHRRLGRRYQLCFSHTLRAGSSGTNCGSGYVSELLGLFSSSWVDWSSLSVRVLALSLFYHVLLLSYGGLLFFEGSQRGSWVGPEERGGGETGRSGGRENWSGYIVWEEDLFSIFLLNVCE